MERSCRTCQHFGKQAYQEPCKTCGFDDVLPSWQPAAPAQTDPVNHPPHYTSGPAKCTCGQTIECIQITEHMGFNPGNAIKYIWRHGLKGDPKATAIEDLKKAQWYLDREIGRLEKEGS